MKNPKDKGKNPLYSSEVPSYNHQSNTPVNQCIHMYERYTHFIFNNTSFPIFHVFLAWQEREILLLNLDGSKKDSLKRKGQRTNNTPHKFDLELVKRNKEKAIGPTS